MQILLTVLIALVVAFAPVLAYAATRPCSFRIARRITVDAPRERVVPLVADFQRLARVVALLVGKDFEAGLASLKAKAEARV